MTSTKPKKKTRSKRKSQPELTEEEQRALQEREQRIRERRAETQLELAKLFLTKEQHNIARRRLKEIVAEFAGLAAATEAKTLLKTL